MDPADLIRAVRARPECANLRESAVELGGGLLAYAADRAQPPEHRIYEPVLTLALQGCKTVRTGGRVFELSAGHALIVAVDLAVLSRVTEAPYLAVSIRPDLDVIRDLAAAFPARHAEGVHASPACGAAAPDVRLHDAMARLVSLLDDPRALAAIGPLIRREIHFWMLEGPHGAILRRMARIDGAAERIARAIAAIRADPSRPLRVPDIARSAGMSASAFHAWFRMLTATSPLQFQKQLRLVEARRRLQSGSSVSEAAFAVGYESPTQFARDFRRNFNSTPREMRGRPDSGALVPDSRLGAIP